MMIASMSVWFIVAFIVIRTIYLAFFWKTQKFWFLIWANLAAVLVISLVLSEGVVKNIVR